MTGFGCGSGLGRVRDREERVVRVVIRRRQCIVWSVVGVLCFCFFDCGDRELDKRGKRNWSVEIKEG